MSLKLSGGSSFAGHYLRKLSHDIFGQIDQTERETAHQPVTDGLFLSQSCQLVI